MIETARLRLRDWNEADIEPYPAKLLPRQHSAEPAHHRRRVGMADAAASLDFAFDRFDAGRVVAITFAGNEASWELMERLGMKRRPDLDHGDPRFPEINPTIAYAIAREEWRP